MRRTASTYIPSPFPLPLGRPTGGSIPGSWDVLPSSPRGSEQAQDAAQQAAHLKRARRAEIRRWFNDWMNPRIVEGLGA